MPRGGLMREDDRHAFRLAFEAHFARLAAYAYRYLRAVDAAEDVVQDVFANLWCLQGRLDDIDNLSAYLFRAVRNRSLNQLRRRRLEERHPAVASSMVQGGEWPSAAVELDELAGAVEVAIQALPTRTRQVFLLSRVEGMSYREIADTLGISVKTVETLMSRALRRVRDGIRAGQSGPSATGAPVTVTGIMDSNNGRDDARRG